MPSFSPLPPLQYHGHVRNSILPTIKIYYLGLPNFPEKKPLALEESRNLHWLLGEIQYSTMCMRLILSISPFPLDSVLECSKGIGIECLSVEGGWYRGVSIMVYHSDFAEVRVSPSTMRSFDFG